MKVSITDTFYAFIVLGMRCEEKLSINNSIFFGGYDNSPRALRSELKQAGIRGDNIKGDQYAYIPNAGKIKAFLSYLLTKNGTLTITNHS